MSDFAGYVVNRLFTIGLKLESTRSIAGADPACEQIRAVAGEIDQLINDIRVTTLNPTAHSEVTLKEHMAFTAREVQARALDAAARLERQADEGLDHRAEIRLWQAFADQADWMAKRWE